MEAIIFNEMIIVFIRGYVSYIQYVEVLIRKKFVHANNLSMLSERTLELYYVCLYRHWVIKSSFSPLDTVY